MILISLEGSGELAGTFKLFSSKKCSNFPTKQPNTF